MKILFLTDGIHPFQIGGMQKHSLILSRLLAERGVWMRLYHIGGKDYSPDEFQLLYGSEISYISEKVIPWPQATRLPGHYVRENKKYSELIFNDVKETLHEYDLIYAQGFTGWYFILQRERGQMHVPVIVNFHGFEMFQKAPTTRVWLEYTMLKKAVRYNVLHADGVYSFGAQITKILEDIQVSQDRILLQSNGIEESWLLNAPQKGNENTPRVFTFIGRNERRKGIEELNTALKKLILRREVPFTFNFVGPIPEEVMIKDSRITYHGEMRDAEKIKDILQQSDCLICPSHSEGMPTVILEAMASGLAIIATDVGAVSRMIDGNGILLSNAQPDLIQKAIEEIIALSQGDLNRMKEKSIQLIQNNFLWDVIADQKLAQFRKIISLD